MASATRCGLQPQRAALSERRSRPVRRTLVGCARPGHAARRSCTVAAGQRWGRPLDRSRRSYGPATGHKRELEHLCCRVARGTDSSQEEYDYDYAEESSEAWTREQWEEKLGVAVGGRAAARLALSETLLWAAAAFAAVAHPEIVLTSLFTTDHPITLADYKLALDGDVFRSSEVFLMQLLGMGATGLGLLWLTAYIGLRKGQDDIRRGGDDDIQILGESVVASLIRPLTLITFLLRISSAPLIVECLTRGEVTPLSLTVILAVSLQQSILGISVLYALRTVPPLAEVETDRGTVEYLGQLEYRLEETARALRDSTERARQVYKDYYSFRTQQAELRVSKLEEGASAAAQQAANAAIALQDARRDTAVLQKALADARREIERMQGECDVDLSEAGGEGESNSSPEAR